MKKKGVALPVNTMIYLLIALVVLVLLLFIFQDQSKIFLEGVRNFFNLADSGIPK